MSTKATLLRLVKNNVNLGGLVADTLDEVLEPALKKVVERTDNAFDDMLFTAVYPILEKELNEEVEKLVNKLLSVEEDAGA